jgi:type I restriction enzyme S subunit
MTSRLGEYVGLQRGNSYKSALLGLDGPVLLGLGSIARNGGFKGGDLKTYGGPSDPRILLRPGDIYVSLKDVTQSGDLLGAVARVPSFIRQGRLTQDTVKLFFRSSDAPRDYIYWLLQTPDYRAYCRAHATGTTNLGLPREDFLAFPVPPLTQERRTIVESLQALDDKIELNRRMNETLEAMARAIFQDWFVAFGPTRAKMDGRPPTLAPDLWALFPDRLDDEGKPEGWTSDTLARVADLNPEAWSSRTMPSEIEYLDLSGCKNGEIEELQVLRREVAPSRAQRVLRAGDTVVGTVRPGNRSFALIGRDGITGSTGFAVLRPKHPSYRESVYLAATADDSIAFLAHRADGAAYPAVRPDVVAGLPIIWPGHACLVAFSSVVAPMIDRAHANRVESRTLATTRDLLLPCLMSGELDIRDAERALEAVP